MSRARPRHTSSQDDSPQEPRRAMLTRVDLRARARCARRGSTNAEPHTEARMARLGEWATLVARPPLRTDTSPPCGTCSPFFTGAKRKRERIPVKVVDRARSMLLEAGQVIDGKYRLTRLIGTGGMGAVYEGENILIRRRVALKVLNAASAGSQDIIRRFEREAQAAGEIGNDHILEVLDLGSLPDGDRYMVMEYLDGETLAARIERHGRLSPGQLAPIARQFLTALASAHAAGIIHRDLKPENIF